MNNCVKCILPHDYPGITFNSEGVCKFCIDYKQLEYQDPGKLADFFKSGKKDSKYDCAIGFSGGRDSSYLLHYFSQVLNLSVLAITVDNGYMSKDAIENVKKLAEDFKVDIVFKKHKYLEYSFPRNLNSWAAKPDPALIIALCNGCRFGMKKSIYEVMRDYNIGVLVDGATPLEPNPYKEKLFRLNPNSKSKMSLLVGITYHLLKNSRWISNPYNMYIFVMEFLAFYGKIYDKKMIKAGIKLLSPFYEYIHWEEKKIDSTLKNDTKWSLSNQAVSTWRSDCLIAFLKGYLYKHTLGYNDQDGLLSTLIRDGQLTREEVTARISQEQYIPEDYIQELFNKTNVDFNEMVKTLKRKNLYKDVAN